MRRDEFFPEFQFQYGAIERLLKAYRAGSITMFQFQYGAIESITVEDRYYRPRKFQFQYGAIESKKSLTAPLFVLSFNSSMELKLRTKRGAVNDFLSFNSSMVRLKVYKNEPSISQKQGFNSSMVRLKGTGARCMM